ncbi:hypothetical protein I3760_03G150900 [Carya illinoinensis]|nr:hypothetical protein I3760_03G150900 [Carya illinoinensis]
MKLTYWGIPNTFILIGISDLNLVPMVDSLGNVLERTCR